MDRISRRRGNADVICDWSNSEHERKLRNAKHTTPQNLRLECTPHASLVRRVIRICRRRALASVTDCELGAMLDDGSSSDLRRPNGERSMGESNALDTMQSVWARGRRVTAQRVNGMDAELVHRSNRTCLELRRVMMERMFMAMVMLVMAAT
eukprot:642195-Pleurochrysis_carterae.AAC.2